MSAYPSPVQAVGAGPLIGREAELALVRSFLRRSAEVGDCLLLCGDPGMGKSVILDSAVGAAGEALVLSASGCQYETDMAFSGLNQLLLPLRGHISQLAPALRVPLAVAVGFDDGPPPNQVAVFEAALALLRTASNRVPTLVVVDDLQWLDAASAATIDFLADHVAGTRIGILAAYRPGANFAADHRMSAVYELPPLSEMASVTLVSTHYPTLQPALCRRVLEEAQGNPLALLELARVVSNDQLARRSALPLTRRLNMLYASSINSLPDAARPLLLLAALDDSGELQTLQAAAPGRDVPGALTPAADAHLVTLSTAAGRFNFRHPLVRSAVIETSTGTERRAAHAALAAVLTDDSDRKVWHLAGAASQPDETVADQLEQAAGRSRRRGEPHDAVWALGRSADLSCGAAARARRMVMAAYLEAEVTGELGHASRRLAQVRQIEHRTGASPHSAITAACISFHSDGNVDFAHHALTAAITECLNAGEASNPMVVEAMHNLFQVCLSGARPELWESLFRIIDRRGFRGSPLLKLWTMTLADPARTAAGALKQLDREITALANEKDPTRIERVATAARFIDRVQDCREALLRVIEQGRAGVAVAAAINALTLLCVDDFRAGRWDEAQQLTCEGIELCQSRGYQLSIWPLQFAQAYLSAGRGDDATTQAIAGGLAQWVSSTGADSLRHFSHHALALSALGRGDYEDAFQHAAAISPAGVLAPNVGHALWAALDLVEAAVRANRHAEALAHVDAMRQAGIAELSTRLAVVVAGSAAMAATDADFAPLFEEALELPGAADWPFAHARLHLMYGERLRRTRAIAKARHHLEAAAHIFRRMGAQPWIVRAEAESRAAGAQTKQVDVKSTVMLTPQELQVAGLAASGLTNKQIAERLGISHRTVGAHLEQVFPKLGINSRAALGEALAGIPNAVDDGP
jgi:DNA-binding CsgD family transcriptional regulator